MLFASLEMSRSLQSEFVSKRVGESCCARSDTANNDDVMKDDCYCNLR